MANITICGKINLERMNFWIIIFKKFTIYYFKFEFWTVQQQLFETRDSQTHIITAVYNNLFIILLHNPDNRSTCIGISNLLAIFLFNFYVWKNIFYTVWKLSIFYNNTLVFKEKFSFFFYFIKYLINILIFLITTYTCLKIWIYKYLINIILYLK